MAIDISNGEDNRRRQREQAFREEAQALRKNLVQYMAGDLADGELKEAAQRVIRESFQDLVQRTLREGSLHRQIAGDLAATLIEGLRQSLPGLEEQALAAIRSDLDEQWTRLLPELTREALQRVVEQRLVPQDLPDMLRQFLTRALAQRDPELRRELEAQQKNQADLLREELNQRWRSSLPEVIQKSMEQAVSGHLTPEMLSAQVESVVNRYLKNIDLTIRRRLDLNDTIAVQQKSEIEKTRSDISARWREALPGMVQQGLSTALSQEFSSGSFIDIVSDQIETAVKQRAEAIEAVIRRDLDIRKHLNERQPEWEQLLTEHWKQFLPIMFSETFEKVLLDQLAGGVLDERLKTLIDVRIEQQLLKKESRETTLLHQESEKGPEDALSVMEVPRLQDLDEKAEPQITQEVGRQSDHKHGKTVAFSTRNGLLKTFDKLRAEFKWPWNKRARWVAAFAVGIPLVLASFLVWGHGKKEPTQASQPEQQATQSQGVTGAPPARENPEPKTTPFSLQEAWKQSIAQEAALTGLLQTGTTVDDLFVCWFQGKDGELNQLWSQQRATNMNAEDLKKAFPACAYFAPLDPAATFSAQTAVKKALSSPAFQRKCVEKDRQLAATTSSELKADGQFNSGTKSAFDLFIRCAGLTQSFRLPADPQRPSRLQHLFIIYAALREAAPQ